MNKQNESICRNCFHSYVCEQFNENKDDSNEKCHFFNDHYVPTADVVPKSEVERLVDKWIGEENLTKDEKTLRLIEALQDEARRYERYYFNHEYDKLIAEAKVEAAREIFEEFYRLVCSRIPMNIQPIFKDDKDFDGGFINGKRDTLLEVLMLIANLKKKYTEER